jgi:hypothetical protein
LFVIGRCPTFLYSVICEIRVCSGRKSKSSSRKHERLKARKGKIARSEAPRPPGRGFASRAYAPGKEDCHFCIAPLDPALPDGACGEQAGQNSGSWLLYSTYSCCLVWFWLIGVGPVPNTARALHNPLECLTIKATWFPRRTLTFVSSAL